MDCIFLNNISFHAKHGVAKAEREVGRLFQMDVYIFFDTENASKTDSINDTVDYAKVAAIATQVAQNSSVKLLETLAEKIAGALFNEISKLKKIRIVLRKLHPHMDVLVDSAGVDITRER